MYKQLIIDILVNPQVRKLVPGISSVTLAAIENWLGTMKGQFYLTAIDAVYASTGLKIQDRKVMLDNDWGVKLVGTQHTFLYKPTNIRFTNHRFCITNTADVTSNGACTVLDENLNLLTQIGSKGANFGAGEYTFAGDMTFDPTSAKYLVACPDDHIIQRFSDKGVFVDTLGTPGVAGTPSGATIAFDNPIAVGVGTRGLYVACGGTSAGYVEKILPDLSVAERILYPGKNGGTGKIFEGEVKNIKDMVVLSNPDKLIILNGTDEIGIFDVDSSGYVLEKVINIPSDIYSPSLGLNRLTVDATTIYVSASATGEIIAIDRATGEFLGKFGELRNESTLNSDHTLGCFNGLSGLTLFQDRLVTTESINNRVQSFGSSLCKNPQFAIDFTSILVSDTSQMKYITVPAGTIVPQDVRVVDTSDNKEYTVETAIARKTKRFFVRFYLKPSTFSLQKRALDLFPIHVLCEDTN